MNSIIDILSFDINRHILSYLRDLERAQLAVICKDFYEITKNIMRCDYNPPSLAINIDIENNQNVRITFNHKDIDYCVFKRILHYHKHLIFDARGNQFPIKLQTLLTECQPLITECPFVSCYVPIWFTKFRNFNIKFNNLKCLRLDFTDDTHIISNFFNDNNSFYDNNFNQLTYFHAECEIYTVKPLLKMLEKKCFQNIKCLNVEYAMFKPGVITLDLTDISCIKNITHLKIPANANLCLNSSLLPIKNNIKNLYLYAENIDNINIENLFKKNGISKYNEITELHIGYLQYIGEDIIDNIIIENIIFKPYFKKLKKIDIYCGPIIIKNNQKLEKIKQKNKQQTKKMNDLILTLHSANSLNEKQITDFKSCFTFLKNENIFILTKSFIDFRIAFYHFPQI